MTVKIILININDDTPTFPDGSKFTKLVPLPVVANEPAAIIYAHDRDINDPTTYQLSPAFANLHMYIDENGRLHFRETMDLDKAFKIFGPEYLFKITARDTSEPPKTTTSSVKIIFVRYRPQDEPVTCYVPEDTKLKQVIAVVPRYYPDSEMSIIYPEQSQFAINNKGEVILEKRLDYQKEKYYVLTAEEKVKPGKGKGHNNIDIEVTVLDRNNYDPILLPLSRIGVVNANSRAGATIMKISGIDKDFGLNGLAAFQLEADGDVTLNPISGWLQNAGRIQKNSYDVKIYPFDYGLPRRENKPYIFKIYPDQVPPVFTKDIYKFSILEESPGGTIVGTVKAKSASNAKMGYSIIAGNVNNVFSINPMGEIKVNNFISFEEDEVRYVLRVNGSEQIPDALFSIVDVEIQVVDVNEFSPRFQHPVYVVFLREDAVVGTTVVTVKAHDCDCVKGCGCVNSDLRYSILDDSKSFVIDTYSGKIVMSKQLDYEKKTFYALKVIAKDNQKGSDEAIAYVNVTVVNINDNAPRFPEDIKEVDLANDAVANKPLARVRAFDIEYNPITYLLVSGDSLQFKISPNTGVLSLLKQFPENNVKEQYTIRVRAKDNGDGTSLFKDDKVVINIQPDVRETPKFKVSNFLKHSKISDFNVEVFNEVLVFLLKSNII